MKVATRSSVDTPGAPSLARAGKLPGFPARKLIALSVAAALAGALLNSANASGADAGDLPAVGNAVVPASDSAIDAQDRVVLFAKTGDPRESSGFVVRPSMAAESLRELLDKYAPSAIEWTLVVPMFAGRSGADQAVTGTARPA